MVSCELEVQEPSSCSVAQGYLFQLVFCRSRFQQMCWQGSASRQGRGKKIFLLPMSLCRSLAEGVAQIKGMCHHSWSWDVLYFRWHWTQRCPCLNLLGFMATMPQDLHAKIQVRNLYLPASRLVSQVSLRILDCTSFQIQSSWQVGIATTKAFGQMIQPMWKQFGCSFKNRRLG